MIAVQVEHDIGIAGERRERLLHRRELGRGLDRVDVHPQRRTDHIDDGVAVVGFDVVELRLDIGCYAREKIRIAAIEVFARPRFEAPDAAMEQLLGQADRVGDRHQHDLATDAARGLGAIEQRDQVMHDEHAGQFVRVKTRLQIGLLASRRVPAPRAVMQAHEMAFGAQLRRAEPVVMALHAGWASFSGAAGAAVVTPPGVNAACRALPARYRCASARASMRRSTNTSAKVSTR